MTPSKSMVTLCPKEWEAGTPIDDYFYELRTAAEEAGAPLRMACLLLTGQLPPPVQGPMKDWVIVKEEVTKGIARDFIKAVRKSLTEKGIALERGHHDLSRVMVAQPVLEEVIPKGGQTPQQPHSRTEHPNVGTINSVQFAREARQSASSRPYNANKQMTEKGKRLLCYLCGEPNHFQRNCPRQYCQI